MRLPALLHVVGAAPVIDHLWQSTLVALLAVFLAFVLRRHRASLRYWIWFAASMKFLLPFALLIQLGQILRPARTSSPVPSRFSESVEYLAQPFSQLQPTLTAQSAAVSYLREWLPYVLLTIWFCGALAIMLHWARQRRRIQQALRTSSPSAIVAEIPVLVTPSALEPGVFGPFRPVLLLPAGIAERLTPSELRAIVAHEMCHVRRKDNLTSALHMLVEALFWFHPLVWWMGARLIDERERACDEHVLALGSDPQVYAESILKVCNFYLESPLFCTAGVTGSNLKKRIEAIMLNRAARHLSLSKKLLLTAAAVTSVLVPFAFGVLHAAQSGPNSQSPQIVTASLYTAPALRVYETVSVRPSGTASSAPPAAEFRPDGFSATNVTLQVLIRQAYGVADYQIAGAPNWLNRDRYDIEAKVDDSLAQQLRRGNVTQLAAGQQPMLLELLADRFNLSAHRETRQLPAYALVIAASGSKLHAATPGETYTGGIKDANGNSHGDLLRWLRGQVIGQGIPISLLAHQLSDEMGRPVLDRTGLTGPYDFTLRWDDARVIAAEYIVESRRPGIVSKPPRLDPPTAQSEFAGVSIFTALRDQLGLELIESTEQTVPTQLLVIDSAKPASPDDPANSNQPQSQPTLAFATSSVKPNTTNTPMAGFKIKGTNFTAVMFKPDRFMATNFTVRQLIRIAYQVQEEQIVGADWINSEKYDIDARIDDAAVEKLNKLDPEQSSAERRLMLQALLADQFRFAMHRDTRTLPAYILTVAGTGTKLKAATPGDTYPNGAKGVADAPAGPGQWETEHGKELFQGTPVSSLVRFLSDRLHHIVLDRTGLTARYDFTLQWTPISPESSSPSIVSAVHDQLGLRLQQQDSPVEVLVIDHAEPPK